MLMYSPAVDVVRYTNGTLVSLTSTASSFTSVDYNPETKIGTYQPSAITIFATLSGDISLDGWQYSIDGGENWTDVVSGTHGLTVNDMALIVDATTDLFERNNYIVFKAIADDPIYYDTLAITREVDPTIVYDRTWTNIEQTNEKIALIASEEQLAQFSDSSTLVSKVAQVEQTAAEFRSTVTSSYATKSYADNSASAAKSDAISAASTDATSKANAAKQAAISAAATDATNKANNAKADAVDEALDAVDGILNDYVLQTSLTTALEQTSEEILASAREELTVNENLFPMSEAYLNKVLNGLGTLSDNTTKSYVSSQFIPVTPGDHYTFQVWTEQSTNILTKYAYFNSSKTLISTYPSGNNVSTYTNTSHVTIPLNIPSSAAYLVISFGNEQTNGSNCWAKVERNGPTKYVDANVDTRIENARYSQLSVSVGEINSTVAEKVGKTEISSTINQTAQGVTIDASKINFNGAVSMNEKFKILTDGTLEAVDGKFSGTISASTINGSVINAGGSNSPGSIQVYDATGNNIGSWDANGINIAKGTISLGNKFSVDANGKLTCVDANATGLIKMVKNISSGLDAIGTIGSFSEIVPQYVQPQTMYGLDLHNEGNNANYLHISTYQNTWATSNSRVWISSNKRIVMTSEVSSYSDYGFQLDLSKDHFLILDSHQSTRLAARSDGSGAFCNVSFDGYGGVTGAGTFDVSSLRATAVSIKKGATGSDIVLSRLGFTNVPNVLYINSPTLISRTSYMSGYVFQVGGGIYATGPITGNSDERKKDILDWGDDIDSFIQELEPIHFTWKKGVEGADDRAHFGLGAQRTIALLEKYGMDDGALADYDAENDEYGVTYDELAPMMLPSIQKDRKLIEELQSENLAMAKKISALEEKNELLGQKILDLTNMMETIMQRLAATTGGNTCE